MQRSVLTARCPQYQISLPVGYMLLTKAQMWPCGARLWCGNLCREATWQWSIVQPQALACSKWVLSAYHLSRHTTFNRTEYCHTINSIAKFCRGKSSSSEQQQTLASCLSQGLQRGYQCRVWNLDVRQVPQSIASVQSHFRLPTGMPFSLLFL